MGNAEEAQRLYLEARASSPQAERTLPVYHAALAACCVAIRANPARHTQLVLELLLPAVNAARSKQDAEEIALAQVLLERAFGVLEDVRASGLRPSVDSHHLAMAAAAYAQQLERAWDLFSEHLVWPEQLHDHQQ